MALPGKASGEGGEGQLSRNGTTTTAMSVIQSLTELHTELACTTAEIDKATTNQPVPQLGLGNISISHISEGPKTGFAENLLPAHPLRNIPTQRFRAAFWMWRGLENAICMMDIFS